MDKVKFHDKEVPTLGDMQDLHNNVETWTEFLNSKFVTDRDIVCMGMDVEESSPASMSVAVKVDTTKGYGLAMTDDGETIYLSGNDTVAIAAADPGSARIDTVSIKLDHDDADNAYRWFRTTGSGLSSSLVATREDHGYALTVAEGTPGSGVAPATPAGYMKLAEVTVGAGVTSILNANIDDADSSDSWTTEADATIRETKLGKFRMFEQNGFYLLQYDGSTVISFDTTGDIVIGGNLTVEGTFTKLQTETVEIYDNILLLNSNVTGAASQDGGIQIQRGSTGADASLIWNETSDVWSCGLAGSEVEIVTLSGSQVLTNKTLTTPTIGSFTNATHDHADAAGGGTIGYSDLTGTPTSSSWTHNSLTGLDDGDYKHFTATNYTDLTDSGDTTLHYHAADRALADATGDLAYLRVASITATSGSGSTSTLSRADHAHTGADGSAVLSTTYLRSDESDTMTGTLTATNFEYGTALENYYSISSHAVFTPDDQNLYYSDGGVYTSGTGRIVKTGVNLPEGAVITELYGYIYDLLNNQLVTIDLKRLSHDGSTDEVIASVATTNLEMDGYYAKQDTSISEPIVDTEDYSYYLLITFSAAHANLRFVGARIKYTMLKPIVVV